MGKIKKDLTGEKFPHFVVLGRIHKESNGEKSAGRKVLYWECQCECGNIFYGQTYDLLSERIISCGCIRRPRKKEDKPRKQRKKEDKPRKTHKKIALGKVGNKTPRNKSGYVGVYWVDRDQRWKAYIDFCGKRYWLGAYVSKEDAIAARIAGENQLRVEIEQIKNESTVKSNTLYEKGIETHVFLKDFLGKSRKRRKTSENPG